MTKEKQPNTATVQLETPIVRGEQTITSVTLRKPVAGELRGLKLFDLVQMDVTALITVLPRISTPALTSNDVAFLDTADLMELGAEVAGFHDEGSGQSGWPARVEDFMADVATVFHWPLSEMLGWTLQELIEWRERARARSGAE